jgi:hypothetical protein
MVRCGPGIGPARCDVSLSAIPALPALAGRGGIARRPRYPLGFRGVRSIQMLSITTARSGIGPGSDSPFLLVATPDQRLVRHPGRSGAAALSLVRIPFAPGGAATIAPRHVGIILDGNRRFGRRSGVAYPLLIYRRGAEKLDDVLDWCGELVIPAVTLWVCSTENLSSSMACSAGRSTISSLALSATATTLHARARVRCQARRDSNLPGRHPWSGANPRAHRSDAYRRRPSMTVSRRWHEA